MKLTRELFTVVLDYNNDRSGVAWFRLGIWKRRGLRWGEHGEGQIPLTYARAERILHVFLKYPEERR